MNFSILLTLQFYSLFLTYSLADDDIDCDSLVKEKECWSQSIFMYEHCEKECKQWHKEKEKQDLHYIDDEEFFELSAKSSTGKKINFEQFEGYCTIIVNMVKGCAGQIEDIESYFSSLEQIPRISPYAIQVIAFPYEHPRLEYAEADCTLFEQAAVKPGRNIHVTELSKINGPDAHPVFLFFMESAGIDYIDYDIPTFFVVSNSGDVLDVHQGSTLKSVMEILRTSLDVDFHGDEL